MLKCLQQASDSDAYCTLSSLLYACTRATFKIVHIKKLKTLSLSNVKKESRAIERVSRFKERIKFHSTLLALDGAVVNFMNASEFNMQRYSIACSAYKVDSSFIRQLN